LQSFRLRQQRLASVSAATNSQSATGFELSGTQLPGVIIHVLFMTFFVSRGATFFPIFHKRILSFPAPNCQV
jgi:hypothetical protein